MLPAPVDSQRCDTASETPPGTQRPSSSSRASERCRREAFRQPEGVRLRVEHPVSERHHVGRREQEVQVFQRLSQEERLRNTRAVHDSTRGPWSRTAQRQDAGVKAGMSSATAILIALHGYQAPLRTCTQVSSEASGACRNRTCMVLSCWTGSAATLLVPLYPASTLQCLSMASNTLQRLACSRPPKRRTVSIFGRQMQIATGSVAARAEPCGGSRVCQQSAAKHPVLELSLSMHRGLQVR